MLCSTDALPQLSTAPPRRVVALYPAQIGTTEQSVVSSSSSQANPPSEQDSNINDLPSTSGHNTEITYTGDNIEYNLDIMFDSDASDDFESPRYSPIGNFYYNFHHNKRLIWFLLLVATPKRVRVDSSDDEYIPQVTKAAKKFLDTVINELDSDIGTKRATRSQNRSSTVSCYSVYFRTALIFANITL